jgi:hypothetical protein
MNKDWPWDKIFNQPDGETIKQELVTYRKNGNKLIKETVTRNFWADDYQDSTATEVIYVDED